MRVLRRASSSSMRGMEAGYPPSWLSYRFQCLCSYADHFWHLTLGVMPIFGRIFQTVIFATHQTLTHGYLHPTSWGFFVDCALMQSGVDCSSLAFLDLPQCIEFFVHLGALWEVGPTMIPLKIMWNPSYLACHHVRKVMEHRQDPPSKRWLKRWGGESSYCGVSSLLLGPSRGSAMGALLRHFLLRVDDKYVCIQNGAGGMPPNSSVAEKS